MKSSWNRVWVGAWIAIALVLVLGVARVRIDNSPDSWISHRSPAARIHNQIVEQFGPDEYISFVRFDVDPFDDSQWSDQRHLASALRQHPGVVRVDSMPELMKSLGRDSEAPPDNDLRRSLQDARFTKGTLLGRNGRAIRLFAWVRAGKSAERAALLDQLRRIAESSGEWSVAGPVTFNVDLDRIVRANGIRIGIYLAIATILFGAFLFRRSGALAGLALGGLLPCVVWFGLCGWLGLSLNGAQLGALPFLAIIGLETFVHLWSEAATNKIDFREAAHRLRRPFFFAMITTALSLLALATAPYPFLRTVGYTLPVAVVVAWGLLRFAIPAGLDILSCRPREPRPWRLPIPRFPRTLAVATTIALLIAGLASLALLQTEANIARQLPDKSKLARTLERIDRDFGGSLALLVRIKSPHGLPGNLENERQLAGTLDSYGATVIGPAAWLQLRETVAGNTSLLFQAIQLAETPAEATRAFVHGDTTLVRVIIPQLSGAEIQDVRELIEANQGAERIVTGTTANLMDVQIHILRQTARSFALSLLLVTICISFLLRSVRVGLTALAVNLIPFAVTLILFAGTGWAVDMTNSQLFSMLFGFVVNSTVFMLASLNHPASIPHRARAIVLAGALGAVLFSGLALTTLPSLQHFGLLAGSTIAAACFADVVLLPALHPSRQSPR